MAAVLASPEKETDRRASKDLPHLSLSLESPLNSSPFPSPSSSFIPPPVPGPHEYANKLPIPVSKKKQQRDSADSHSSAQAPSPTPTSSTAPAPVATTPTAASAAPSSVPTNMNTSSMTNGAPKGGNSTKPTAEEVATSAERGDMLEQMRGEVQQQQHQPESHSSSAANKRVSHISTSSLNSSRRAPPSPSVSRRASGAHNLNNVSTKDSGTNNRNSVSLSRANSLAARNLGGSALAPNIVATAGGGAEAKRRSRGIKIRDFAYPASDLRHTGQGPDAPRPGQPSRPASQYGQYGEDMSSSSRRNSGWGAFRWAGSKLWGFALGNGAGGGSGNGKQRATLSTDGEAFVPTSSDFARNFDVSSPHEEHPSVGGDGFGSTFQDEYGYSESSSSQDPYEDYQDPSLEDGEGYPDQYPDTDIPLLPGLYRAMYAFVPEGTAEMALAEDQVVRIVGRGGGVGWAVAVDEERGGHALVPESYLEVVRLDGEDGKGEEGEGEGGQGRRD